MESSIQRSIESIGDSDMDRNEEIYEEVEELNEN